MNNTLKISKYLFIEFIKSLAIYYAVILLLNTFVTASFLDSNGNMSSKGFEFASVVFLFVAGLNSFKQNFKFLQANNISRKRQLVSGMITFAAVAALMAFIDVLLVNVRIWMMPYESLFTQVYKHNAILPEFAWYFALFFLAVSLGWLITMLYYRCNMIMKTVISFIPILVIILLVKLNAITSGAIDRFILSFTRAALGLNNLNPYMAVLSFLLSTLAVSGLCYILVRRMIIRE